ncbi:hypothetical protein Taro_055002 [Colocasia esculenta]|uniref:Uncharacterized protein n=1 Tax=Colocasia esculenta TaxID=4460 RepID=A0A843XSW3_COLES|nr:hypothetical protein [Colocasia esculenta]
MFEHPYPQPGEEISHRVEHDFRSLRQHRWPPTTGWRQASWTLTQTDVHIPKRLHAVGGLIHGRQCRLPGLRNNPEIPFHLHHSLGHATHVTVPNGNTVNVTVELSSFGRPKEEKLKPHLRPLREAATTTWSKHFLGHSQPSQLGCQRGQPTTHHRQRETSDVREPPEDTHSRHGDTVAAKRIVHSLFSGDHGGTSSAATISVFIQANDIRFGRQPRLASTFPVVEFMLASTLSSVTGGSFLSSILASPHILGQPFFGL